MFITEGATMKQEGWNTGLCPRYNRHGERAGSGQAKSPHFTITRRSIGDNLRIPTSSYVQLVFQNAFNLGAFFSMTVQISHVAGRWMNLEEQLDQKCVYESEQGLELVCQTLERYPKI